MTSHLRPSLVMLGMLTVLLGLAYPLGLTGLAQLTLHRRANGSLVEANGAVVGSALIGQEFQSPGAFWGRISATSARPYDASASSGSNLAPSNPALHDAAKKRVDALRAGHPSPGPIPVDLVTSSGSGLDPHVSPAAALWQVPRVAQARGLPAERVKALVESHVEPRWLGLLGEPRVNVLALNRALAALGAEKR
jgi:K+-transporting ATPase ATPase C chain